MNNPFQLKNAALLMALAAIYPLHAQAPPPALRSLRSAMSTCAAALRLCR